MIDEFFGRLSVITAAATDSYAESQITFPSINIAQGQKNVLVPVLREIELQWVGNLGALSADAQLVAEICNLDLAQISGIAASGIADYWTIVDWRQAVALTTSGQINIQNNFRWAAPGAGLILLNPYLAVVQSNTATGISLSLAARVWYEFTSMSQETYLMSLHAF